MISTFSSQIKNPNKTQSMWLSHLFWENPNNEEEQCSLLAVWFSMFCIFYMQTEHSISCPALSTYQRPFCLWEELSKLWEQILLSSEQIGHFSEHFLLWHAPEGSALGVQLLFLKRYTKMFNRVKRYLTLPENSSWARNSNATELERTLSQPQVLTGPPCTHRITNSAEGE